VQLVRDEHDRVPVIRETAKPSQQIFGLCRREDRGWLVENEHARVAGQRFHDL
jgi:hypothetical protein